MIKVVAVFIAVAVIGGALYWGYTNFLSPMIGSTIPSLGGIITSLTQQVQPVITYVKDNALQVGSITTAVGGAVAWISTKVYKANLQKKEIETTIKQNGLQTDLFQKQGEVLGLQNQLTDAQSKITMLETGASNVKTLADQLQAKVSEVEKLTAEKNALERLFPNVKTAEQMIKEAQQVP